MTPFESWLLALTAMPYRNRRQFALLLLALPVVVGAGCKVWAGWGEWMPGVLW